MTDNFLSQAEIDALLNQASPTDDVAKSAKAVLDKMIAVLGQFINKTVEAERLEPVETDRVQLIPALSGLVLIPMQFTPHGRCVVALDEEVAAKVAAVAMGQDGSNAVAVDEMGLGVIQEAFSQIAGGVATEAASKAKTKVAVGPVNPVIYTGDPQELDQALGTSELASSKTNLHLDDLVSGEVWILVDADFEEYWSEAVEEAAATAAIPVTPQAPRSYSHTPPASAAAQPASEVTIKKAVFEPLDKVDSGQYQNINLLMDVPLEVTVELGRTKMQIKDILSLGKGSLIELSKLAGEPVDIIVNGKLLAKGEVVVIDENFGVKIVDIVSPVERVNNLQ